MKLFFSPAIALMNRLGYTKKFTLLALISMVAFATVTYSLYASLNEEIRASERELEGLALIEPISRAVQLIQRHRGFSAAFLSGTEVMQDRRTNEREAAQAFDAVDGKLPAKLSETEGWRRNKANWERLQKEGVSMTVADNFAAHTSLIEKLLTFQVAVADEYALTLDPQMDTYYLIDTTINKLPDALEHMGQLRAYCISILSRKQIGEEQKIRIFKIIGMLDEALSNLNDNLEKTGRYNPSIQSSLLATSRDVRDSAQRVVSVIESDILTGHFTAPLEEMFAITTLAIDKSYAQMYESLLPTTETLLKARIARAKDVLHVSIGIALLLLLIVAYFAIGIYYSIIDSVRLLARSARVFANGDMSERVRLGTHDELRQVADSFNEMADGFNAILVSRKQAEENLHRYNKELEEINIQLHETQNMLQQSEKMASVGQLAAGVAHEINNPIGYVYSNLGTLEKYVQDAFGMIEQYEQADGAISDEAVRAQLKAAREKLDIAFLKEDLRALMGESKDGITRVKKIVQNLKDFSHVGASDEWRFADLHSGIDSTLNIVNNEIKYKANVVKEYGDIPEVECLPSQLNQVFMNLLVNAAHAIEERGTITIRTGRQAEEVWVEVADTGKGIAPENLKKIFDPFFTTKPVGKGTGLGLSLSYGIIQKHHGRIEVQSEPGKGTTFRVWLPVKQPQAETVGHERALA